MSDNCFAGNLLLYICRRFKWTRVAMISSQGPVITPLSDFFKELPIEDDSFYLARHFSNISRTSSEENITNRLSIISRETRG
jgi:hypothetical protein